ncbi:DUF4194 domain-containing protein (plasmid) [Synechocystis sp. B12]|nr:DUF4194 domain-containing protein [Synechocystis sp. B12]
MPRTWEKLANDDPIYSSESEFQAAAYQLVTAQVLYEQDAAQRVSYHLVRRYPGDFKEALLLFGMELIINDDYRYCAAVPRESRKVLLPLRETLLILVMRQLFHERALGSASARPRRRSMRRRKLKPLRASAKGTSWPSMTRPCPVETAMRSRRCRPMTASSGPACAGSGANQDR